MKICSPTAEIHNFSIQQKNHLFALLIRKNKKQIQNTMI